MDSRTAKLMVKLGAPALGIGAALALSTPASATPATPDQAITILHDGGKGGNGGNGG